MQQCEFSVEHSGPIWGWCALQGDGSPVEYSGISIDVLAELAKNVKLCYNLTYTPGVRAAGVVNEVLNTSTPVNFGIGSITITAERFAVREPRL
jgi:hypothetical protein